MQVVFITGGSTGIGKATGALLQSSGYKLVGTSRSPDRYKDHPFPLVQMDLHDASSIEKAVQTVISQHGQIDVLINNAGKGIVGPVEETPVEEIRKAFETNPVGAIAVMQAVLPIMRESNKGKIINITSIAGHAIHPFAGSAYSTSKAALSSLTREMANEFADLGVRVNSVAPGEIETAMLSPDTEVLIPRIPLNRLGQPNDIASTIYFLCSEDSTYITGTEIFVTGGQHIL